MSHQATKRGSRLVATGNQGLSCSQHPPPLRLPLNPMECDISRSRAIRERRPHGPVPVASAGASRLRTLRRIFGGPLLDGAPLAGRRGPAVPRGGGPTTARAPCRRSARSTTGSRSRRWGSTTSSRCCGSRASATPTSRATPTPARTSMPARSPMPMRKHSARCSHTR